MGKLALLGHDACAELCEAGAVELLVQLLRSQHHDAPNESGTAYQALLALIQNDDTGCQRRALAAGVLRIAAQLPPERRAVLETALLPAREAAAKLAADALLAELDAEADAAAGPAEPPKRKKKKNKKAHRGAGQQPAAAAAEEVGADDGKGGAELLVAGVPHAAEGAPPAAAAPLPAPHAAAAVPLPVAAAAAAPAVAAPPPPLPLPLPPPAAADSSDEDADDSLPMAEQLRRLRLRNTALRDARNCAVCPAVPKSCMPLPCRHVCACEGCAAALAAQPGALCPLCREGITSWEKVFL